MQHLKVYTTKCWVEYGKDFPSLPVSPASRRVKYEKLGKYLSMLQDATCDTCFIIKWLLKLNMARVFYLLVTVSSLLNLVMIISTSKQDI